MAKITLEKLQHSYQVVPDQEPDWALRQIDFDWDDGGAYALLGPSGCGKTTLLNIISGLIKPTQGRILFDDVDVTLRSPEERNIAQVFQFPVIYDTMTVYDNLAFPLRNRHVAPADIERRVAHIADILELTDQLSVRARNLTPDSKQKISLGRGIVRDDVNVIMFDEPLTVIDPHLKWQLRSKLKELHQRIHRTMIYVTHDQTEALTFADQVVVMKDGQAIQIGTPVELFESPAHTFVGYFIGSPGMNIIPGRCDNATVYLGDHAIAPLPAGQTNQGLIEIGVRPEFITFAPQGLPARIVHVSDIGYTRIVNMDCLGHKIKALLPQGEEIPSDTAYLRFDPAHTHLYRDSWAIGEVNE